MNVSFSYLGKGGGCPREDHPPLPRAWGCYALFGGCSSPAAWPSLDPLPYFLLSFSTPRYLHGRGCKCQYTIPAGTTDLCLHWNVPTGSEVMEDVSDLLSHHAVVVLPDFLSFIFFQMFTLTPHDTRGSPFCLWCMLRSLAPLPMTPEVPLYVLPFVPESSAERNQQNLTSDTPRPLQIHSSLLVQILEITEANMI